MRRNPLVLGALVVVGCLAVLFGFLLPKSAEAARIRSEIDTAQADLASKEAQLAALEQVDAGALGAALVSLRTSIPATPDLSGLLRTMEEAAERSGVEIQSIGPGVPTPSTVASVSVVSLSIEVKGPYFRLAEFLFTLETLDRLNRVSSVSVSPGGVEGQTSVLTMSVSTEIYTTDTSAGPGSSPEDGPELGA